MGGISNTNASRETWASVTLSREEGRIATCHHCSNSTTQIWVPKGPGLSQWETTHTLAHRGLRTGLCTLSRGALICKMMNSLPALKYYSLWLLNVSSSFPKNCPAFSRVCSPMWKHNHAGFCLDLLSLVTIFIIQPQASHLNLSVPQVQQLQNQCADNTLITGLLGGLNEWILICRRCWRQCLAQRECSMSSLLFQTLITSLRNYDNKLLDGIRWQPGI